ncbi:MAG: hypothetical protein RI580_17750, partial [Halothece sp. Uz-M2-17]|nr:hypothetical protein [Halothece sp. Uz-M2-17]
IGGNGDNNADGGDGEDTAVYGGNLADNTVEVIDENTVQVGNNTDTLTNFEFLDFDDQTVEIASLPQPTDGVELFASADDQELDGTPNNDILGAVGFSGNILNGLAGDDELTAGSNGTLNAGDGNDVLEATPGEGGNTLNGDAGNDQLFGGDVVENPDILNGGDGDDQLFAGLGGNTLTGDAGNDQFWLAQAELPEEPSTVTDFTQGTDVIGLAGLEGVVDTFDDLNIDQEDGNTTISVVADAEEITVGVLDGFTGELTEEDFVINEEITQPPEEDPSPAGEEIYRFFNTQTGGHFYTTSEAERDTVIENLPQYEFEGASFATAQPDDENAEEVYRFFNTQTGGHFYTTSEAERDTVIENLPQYEFEDIGFYAYEEDLSETIPVYRFFNTQIGGHFYTPSGEERDTVIENLPQYNFENTGFFANPLSELDVA